MAPTSALFNMIFEKAKSDNKVQALLAQRDQHPQAYMIGLRVEFIKRQNEWLFFEVIFGYHVNTPDLESKDDVQVIVPWNRNTGQFGEVSEPKVF
ncbi:MAG TPA: hypothetical protein VK492_12050 [Chitinophagaceae bacterium]|nr:hypothetical protein [Chitinophagaceae bacterium]